MQEETVVVPEEFRDLFLTSVTGLSVPGPLSRSLTSRFPIPARPAPPPDDPPHPDDVFESDEFHRRASGTVATAPPRKAPRPSPRRRRRKKKPATPRKVPALKLPAVSAAAAAAPPAPPAPEDVLIEVTPEGGVIRRPAPPSSPTGQSPSARSARGRRTHRTALEAVQDIITETQQGGSNRLVLFGRNLKFVPEEIEDLAALEVLDMSCNDISWIPDWFENMTKLSVLNLARNRLTALPPELFLLRASLDQLLLSFNQIASLPPDFGSLYQLRVLDLSYNCLQEFPAALRKLSNLKRLNLAGNELTELPSQFGFLASLRECIVADNRLGALPPSLGRIKTLRFLDISGNKIMALPPEMAFLTELQTLKADNNPIVLPPFQYLDNVCSYYTAVTPCVRQPAFDPQGFRQLLYEELLSDLVITVGPARFPCHKVILSARSSFFRQMLAVHPEEQTFSIEDIRPDVFSNLLCFIYTDDVESDIPALAEDTIAAGRKYTPDNLRQLYSKLGHVAGASRPASGLSSTSQRSQARSEAALPNPAAPSPIPTTQVAASQPTLAAPGLGGKLGSTSLSSLGSKKPTNVVESTLAADLQTLSQTAAGADVKFLIDDHTVYAHRAILCARSRGFRLLFAELDLLDPPRPQSPAGGFVDIPEVTVSQGTHAVFLAVIEFIYSGVVSLDMTVGTAIELLKLADIYLIDYLKELAERFLHYCIDATNAAEMLMVADRNAAEQLYSYAMHYTLAQYDAVCASEGYASLPRHIVQDINAFLRPAQDYDLYLIESSREHRSELVRRGKQGML